MGWALRDSAGNYVSGTEVLLKGKKFSNGRRYTNLTTFLDRVHRDHEITHIAYEHVFVHLGSISSHVYGGYLATLESWCDVNEIPLLAVTVQGVKKAACGKGAASKEVMVRKANARWGLRLCEKKAQDEADARWVCEAAIQKFNL